MVSRSAFAAACVLFFLSGAAGLAYEVLWFKQLSHVWGSSALAGASVLASFLLGLGLGARWIGRRADRLSSPLAAYGWCEVGIGLLALLVPLGLRGLESLAAVLYPFTSGRPLLGSLLRAALSFVVLGPPCFLMGGTFPLLIRHLTPRDGSLRHATGVLYGINTLGGAAGAYAAGFHLLPALGVVATGAIAVGTSLLVGLAALVAARQLRTGIAPDRPPEVHRPLEPGARKAAWAALLSGAGALALQVAWTRQLSLVIGGSTYAFSAMLVVVLLGIALGGLVFQLWLRRVGDLRSAQALVVLVLCLAALAGQWMLEPLIRAVSALRWLRADSLWNAAVSTLAASVLELVPAVCMGVLLPVYAALSTAHGGDAGNAAGRIYAWNTAGTLLGALGAALGILPAWGAAVTVALSLGAYLASALLLHPAEGLRGKLAITAVSPACVAAVIASAGGPDPRILNYGMYHYGGETSGAALGMEQLYLREGRTASVYVARHEEGTISLRVNGKVDASDGLDMTTQLGTAYFPRLLHPRAKEVLVIGFGSGTTSGASLLFTEARVTCVEIEEAVVDAARFFDHVNHKPRESQRYREVIDDGRSFLQGAPERFDLIISEPSNPWMAGVSSLFTREFYEIVKRRLAPDGILGQWVQTYSLTTSDYALQVRTIAEAFPHTALLLLPGTDTFILASQRPLEPSGEVLDESQRLVDGLEPVKGDLDRYFGTADVRSLLLRHWVLGAAGVRAFIQTDSSRGIHTDLNLRLEYDAPLRLFDESLSAGRVRSTVLASAQPAELARRWREWGAGEAQLPALRGLLDFFAEHGAWDPARDMLRFCLEVAPEDPYFLAARFMSSPPEKPEVWDADLERIARKSREDAARIGVWLHAGRDYTGAVRLWRKLLAVDPQAATLWINLHASLEAQGALDEAREALAKARALDPFSSFVRSRAEASKQPGGTR